MPKAAGLYYFASERGNTSTPPVILIHGAGGTHLHWPPDVRRMPQQRVYALDLPGHGKSDGSGEQSIQAYAQHVLSWMEAMNFFQAVFVGHSMGGAIALTLGLEHNDQVAGLGLVGTGARLRVAPQILEATASQTGFDNAVKMITQWAFGPNADPRLKILAEERMAETRPSVLHGDFVGCDLFNQMEEVQNIQRPTLVVCGEEDKLTPSRYSKYLAETIPGAQLKLIPDAGHMVMLERPSAVAKALGEFLEAIPYTPGSG